MIKEFSHGFKRTPILVAGIGNLLMGDDGVGVHAIHAMMGDPRFSDVVLMDVGTSALSVLHDLEQADHLLLLDAIRVGSRPGTLHRLAGESVSAPRTPRSLHEYGVSHVLAQLKSDHQPREVVVLGIEPGEIDFCLTLTNPVALSLPGLVDAAWHIVSDWRQHHSFGLFENLNRDLEIIR